MKLDDLAELQAYWREEPRYFAERVMGLHLWDKEAEILESVRDHAETNVPSCHSSGKSFTSGRAVLPWNLLSFPGSNVVTTAPTTRQVHDILWKEAKAAYRDCKLGPVGQMLDLAWRLQPDWYAIGFTAPDYDPNRFQGYHAPRMVVIKDEAAGITAPINDQIVSLVSGEGGRILSIGNPVESGTPFHHSCRLGRGNVIKISAFDTPNFTAFGITPDDMETDAWRTKIAGRELPYPMLITPKWVHDRWHDWGPDSDSYQSRVLAEFPEYAEGSYYAKFLRRAESEKRITQVKAEPGYEVHTAWDLGKKDKTAIWFYQQVGNQVRLLHYYENQMEEVAFYSGYVKRTREESGWAKGTEFLPHDGAAEVLGRPFSIASQLRNMGHTVHVEPQTKSLNQDIEAVRQILPRCWFDAVECEIGLECLRQYHMQRNARTGEFLNHPEHDEWSHGADAFRTMAVTLRPVVARTAPRGRRQRSWMTR